MDTDLVLDLFRRTTDDESGSKKKKAESSAPASQKNVLEGLEDLPPDTEYDSLDLASFMGTIAK